MFFFNVRGIGLEAQLQCSLLSLCQLVDFQEIKIHQDQGSGRKKNTNLPWQVAKSGPNPEGGFLVELIRVQGKERSAAIGDFLPQMG